jgi:hypothetical protein
MWPASQRSTALRPAPHRQYAPVPRPEPTGRGVPRGAGDLPAQALQFLPVLAQLGLLLAVFKVYRVEGRAFQMLVTIALAVLPVHYLAPLPPEEAALRGGLGRRAGLGSSAPPRRARSSALAALLIGVCYCRSPGAPGPRSSPR